jgi:hypothetical protein
MDQEERQKIIETMEVYSKPPIYPGRQFLISICLTKLEIFSEANEGYRRALHGFLKDSRDWRGTGQPNWLIDCFVMASLPNLYWTIVQEIEAFRSDFHGRSPVENYASALILLINGKDENTTDYIDALHKKPNLKWAYAIGKCIGAVVDRNQYSFNQALEGLLKAHRGMAKFGGLRESPEGLLSLPAMSISMMALNRDISIDVESEYISKDYLKFLNEIDQ